jgi:DNA-directed RNA polymerase subunit RPC12/RpoP
MAEVFERLRQLGLTACPECGSTNSLNMSPIPVLLVKSGTPSEGNGLHQGPDHEDDVTFAIKVECANCSHWMLFNAAKYRTVDETIIEGWSPEGEGGMRGWSTSGPW